ncbi:MAG TPA: hypothetical protein VNE38_15230 [Ktedonobacteraceae bacterium]|nr:hypothetical protein [Ktedonobacteraceae bacterium]
MLARDTYWEGPLSPQKVATQAKAMLFGASARRASVEAIRAEAIRIAVWTQTVTRQSNELSQPAVSTHQVLKVARTLIINADQNEMETPLERELLDDLAEQGDLYAFPGGRWLPAPHRLVPIRDRYYLLAGSLPTHLLPRDVLEMLHLHGSFRAVDATIGNFILPTDGYTPIWQYQPLERWLGPKPPTLHELARKFHTIDGVPVHQQNQELEAYGASMNRPQGLRWQPLHAVNDGQYLLRTAVQFGMREYTRGVIRGHHLVQQSATLRSIDIRRLCYALDNEAHTPTSVNWERDQGKLILRSELPTRERKFLASIGQLQVSQDSYYPRIWMGIAPEFHERVEEMLSQLSVQIVTTPTR